MRVENAMFPSMEQITSFFGGSEHGPFVMVNLLKFKAKAEYADGSDADLSGAEAYARYGRAIQACLAAVGGRQIYAGPVTGLMIGEVDDLLAVVGHGEVRQHQIHLVGLESIDATVGINLDPIRLHTEVGRNLLA